MRSVSFLHITDSHLGPDRDYEYDGLGSYAALSAVVERARDVQRPIDFVVHTGDLAADADPAAYELAREILSTLPWPIYYVAGNHDDRLALGGLMEGLPVRHLLPGSGALAYEFETGGHAFLTFDGTLRSGRSSSSGRLGDAQLSAISEALRGGTRPVTIFGHFPAVPCGVPWIDEEMLLEDGRLLHETLAARSPAIRGVFLGHVHHPSLVTADGVLYSTGPAGVRQIVPGTAHARPVVDHLSGPGFQHVTVRENGVEIVTYALAPETVERPGAER